jgi:hypothetical protein
VDVVSIGWVFDRERLFLSGLGGHRGHHLVIALPDIRNEIRDIVLASVRRFVYGLVSASRGRTIIEPTNDMQITFDTLGNAHVACRGTEDAVSTVAFAGRLAG